MKQETLKALKLASALACAALAANTFAADGKWNADVGDNWNAASRWLNSIIADGAGSTADISFNITAARTLTLNTPRTIGKMRFEDATTSSHDWTFSSSGGSVLTLETLADTPVIEIVNRTVNWNTVIGGYQGFTKTGVGALVLNPYLNNFTGNIVLSAGTTRFRASGTLGGDPGAPTADRITLNGGTIMNNDSELVIPPNFGITLGASGGGIQAGWSKPLTINSPITGAGALTIASDATPGLITLNEANTYTGATTVNGWLRVNGSLDAASAVTVASGGLVVGTGTINGSLAVNAGGNIGGGGLFTPGNLTVNNAATLTGCTLHVDLSDTPAGLNDLLTVNGNLTLGGTILVSITPLAGNLAPGTYRLINYTGTLTGSAANLTAIPSRYSVSFDTSTPGQVNLIVQSGSAASLAWSGSAGVNWDIGMSANWLNGANPDTFRNGDNVLLDDTGDNTLPILILGPNLFNTVAPGSVTVNATKNYTIGGGRFAGPMNLTKQGTGILILNAANGSLPNYFDGQVTIEAGRVRAGYPRALGSTLGATIVKNGASLDVNAQDLGFEPIFAEGAGADGAGALVNYAGGQNNALRTVTMTGDLTIGGTGRFDIRNVESTASLSTGGNPFKLTKKGPNQFSLVGVNVDPMLGEIDVQEGTFGFETTSTLGDANKTLTMGYNTTLILWNLVNAFYKPLVLNGGTAATVNNGSGTSTIVGPVTNLANSVWNVAGTSLTVSSPIVGAGGITKTGGSPLNLDAANTYAGPTVISGGTLVLGAAASISNSPSIALASGTTLNVSAVAAGSPSGAFELNGAIGQTLSGSGTVVGNVSANGSTIIPGTSAGTLTFNGNVNLDSALAVFELGAATTVGSGINDLVAVTGDLTLTNTITVRIKALGNLDTVNPYTIVTYTGTPTFTGSTIIFASDSRYTFIVDLSSPPGTIRIRATAVGAGAEALTWQGTVPGSETLWDFKATANWSNSLAAPDMFYLGDSVRFDDTAVGTTVSLVGPVIPASVTVSNETKDFTWTGAGRLSGPVGILKQGAGKLTIASSELNENSGTTTISGGTLEVGNGGTTGNLNAAAIANAGTLAFNRSDNITVANVISGAGKLEKKGSGIMTLSQSQASLTGPIEVTAGTLRPGNSTSGLGTVAAGTTVASGATLDVNGQTMGNETITVSGSGVGGAGAIYNVGGARQDATRYVVLAGDTTFGGLNRWDVRASGTPSGLIGNGFTLTKTGPNEVWLVGLGDTGLGDITINQGVLGIETTTTMGIPSSTLTINSGATLGFYANNNAATPLNKVMVMNSGNWLNNNGDNYFSGPITLNGQNTFQVDSTLRLTGSIGGPGSLIKNGSGSLHLVNANSFAGNIVHNRGNLVLSNDLAAGSSKTLTVNYNTAVSAGYGVRLYLRNGITTPADLVGVFNTTSLGGDYRTSITSDSLTNTWTGPLLLNGSAIVGFYREGAGNYFKIPGPILGTNGFTGTAFFRGAAGLCGEVSGKLQLPTGTMAITDNTSWLFSNPANEWARTLIAYGRLILGADNAACAAAPLTLGQSGSSSGTLDLNGFNQTVASLTTVNGNNHWITNGSGTADSVFTYDGGANSSTLDGRIVDNLRKLSLTVQSGTLTLLGNNTYVGNTLINGGRLGLGAAGTLAGTPLITLAAGATLDTAAKGAAGLTLANNQTLTGTGTVDGSLTVAAGATLDPGASVASLTVTNILTTLSGGTNVFDLNKTTTPSSDLVNAGSVVYGGTLVLNNLGPALAVGDSFKLFSATTYSGAYAAIIPDKPATGLAWDTSKLTVDGTLGVKVGPPSDATNITAVVTNGVLTLSWPSEYTGWRLEAQTNSINVGLSDAWVEVPGSTTTNVMSFPIDPAQPTVFYRLGYTP
jgi:autotransporter-associated beta strand protein